MRTQESYPLLFAWNVVLAVAGCGGDGPSAEDPTGTDAATDAGREMLDPPDASADAAVRDDAGTTMPPMEGPSDRCFQGPGSCGETVLPAQPEYTFLSEAEDGWLRLVQADWQLAPYSEGYRCVRKTVTEDVYIAGFKPLTPLGTHHTTLHVSPAGALPDGVTVCGVSQGGDRRLQGAAVGAEPTALPEGVAMKVSAGEQVMMNLHLFNASDEILTGTSGMLIKPVAEADVVHEAEAILAGPIALSIPPGHNTVESECALRSDATLFALGPHMHQLGVHMKITAHSAAGDQVLHDQPFDFTHQLLYPIEPVSLAAGDRITIACTYMNDTGNVVGWGDSTLDEMCFVGLNLYPAAGSGGLLICP